MHAHLIVWVITCLAQLFGASVPEPSTSTPATVVHQVRMPPVQIALGEATEIRIAFTIAAGYEVLTSPDDSVYLTRLEVAGATGITTGVASFTQGQDVMFPGTDYELQRHAHTLLVTLPIRIADTAHDGPYRLRGTLHCQTIDAIRCYPVTAIPFIVDIAIGPAECGCTPVSCSEV